MLVYGEQLVAGARTRTGQIAWAEMYAQCLPAAHETGGLEQSYAPLNAQGLSFGC